MAKKWAEVVQSDAYKALTPDEQEQSRQLYFEEVVKPQLAESDWEASKKLFDEETGTQPAFPYQGKIGTASSIETGVFQEIAGFAKDTWAAMKAGGNITRDAFTTLMRQKEYTPLYDGDGNLVDLQLETDDQFKSRIKQSSELRSRTLHAPEKGSAADITGEIANAMIDPVGYVAGAWGVKAATTTARVARMMTAGSAYEGVAATLEQQAESGEITDTNQIVGRAIAGGIAAPTMDFAIRSVAKIVARTPAKKADKALVEFEEKVLKWRQDDLNPRAAVEHAMRDLGYDENTLRVLTSQAGRKVEIRAPRPDVPDDNPSLARKVGQWVTSTSVDAKEGFKAGMDKYLGAVRTRISNMSPRIGHELNKFEMGTHIKLLQARDATAGFRDAVKNLTKAEQKEFKKLLLNSDSSAIEQFIAQQPNTALKEGWAGTRKLLDEIHGQLQDAGYKLGYIEEYFPRLVKDYRQFSKMMHGEEYSAIDTAIRNAAQDKGRALDAVEQSKVIADLFRRKGIGVPGTSHTKGRSVDAINDRMLELYADPIDSLNNYINNTIHNIEKRKFLGFNQVKPVAYDADVKESIFNVISAERLAKNITGREADEISLLLNARFGPGEQAMSKGWQRTKNIFYMATLGNPVSAATQVGDLGISAYMHGFGNTVKSVARSLAKRTDIDIRDLGIDLASQDFASTGKTATALNWVLRKSGFQAVDKLGKNTSINASLSKFRTWAKTEKGVSKIKALYKDAFTPEEMAGVLSDLRSDRISSNVKYMLWNELSGTQPISLSEMPEAYLASPNGRIFYMLKTFTIKQLDILRRQSYNKIKAGKVKEGAYELLKFSGMFGAANMGSDQIKEWLQGRDTALEDKVVAQLWRNFGTSEYIVNKFKQGQPWEGITATVLPPFNIVNTAWQDMAAHGREFNSLQYVPLAGRIMYEWFGGGMEKREAKADRGRRGGRSTNE